MSDQSNSGPGWGAPPPPPAGAGAPPGAAPPPPPGQPAWGAPQPPPGAAPAWGAPQQQGYGAPAQQWGGQTQTDGLQPNIANLLSYFFGFLGGLIIFLTQKNREVRFHGAQSMLLTIAWVVTYIAWTILTFVLGAVSDVLALIFSFGGFALGLAFMGVWIYAMIKGFQEQHAKLPVIGGMAESWAGK